MTQRLTSEDDFLNECRAASSILEYVEKNEADGDVRWFFEECWADWSAPRFTAVFKSYCTPDYQDHLLSVEATQAEDGGWSIRTVKRTPSVAHDGTDTFPPTDSRQAQPHY